MKLTAAFISLLNISSAWALLKVKAGIGRCTSSSLKQAPFVGQLDTNAIGTGWNNNGRPACASHVALKRPQLWGNNHPYTRLLDEGQIFNNDLSNLMKELPYGSNSGATNSKAFKQTEEVSPCDDQPFHNSALQLKQHVSSVPINSVRSEGQGLQSKKGPVLFIPDFYDGKQQQVQGQDLSKQYAYAPAPPFFGVLNFGAGGNSQRKLIPVSKYSRPKSAFSVGNAALLLRDSRISFGDSGNSLTGSRDFFGNPVFSLGDAYKGIKNSGSKVLWSNKAFKPSVFMGAVNNHYLCTSH